MTQNYDLTKAILDKSPVGSLTKKVSSPIFRLTRKLFRLTRVQFRQTRVPVFTPLGLLKRRSCCTYSNPISNILRTPFQKRWYKSLGVQFLDGQVLCNRKPETTIAYEYELQDMGCQFRFTALTWFKKKENRTLAVIIVHTIIIINIHLVYIIIALLHEQICHIGDFADFWSKVLLNCGEKSNQGYKY